MIKKICFIIIFLSNYCYSNGLNSITGNDSQFIIAVGDSGKVVSSTDSGNTWKTRIISDNDLNSVCMKNQFIWIAGSNGFIVKMNINDNSKIYYKISEISLNSIFFADINKGYVCGNNGSIFKTINGGLNWEISNNGINNIDLNSIEFNDKNTGIVCGRSGKIFRTSNSGLSWNEDISNTIYTLFDIKYSDTFIYAIGEYGTLLKNTGGIWVNVDTRTKSDFRSICSDNLNIVRICGGKGFIRNNKNFSNEFLNFENNPMQNNISDIFFANSSTGYAINKDNDAILITTNGGINWNFIAPVSKKYLWINKISNQQNAFGNTLAVHPFNRNTFFVSFGNKVFVSRDKGDTWKEISIINIPGLDRPASLFVSSADTNVWIASVFLTSGDDPVVRTTNYGNTWEIVLDSINIGSYTKPLEMDQNIPGNFYIATVDKGFFKSTDNGFTFESTGNFKFNNPCDITIQYGNSNNILIADASYPSVDSSQIYRTTNGGLNWDKVFTVGLNEIPTITNTIFNFDDAFAAAEKFYLTSDFGNSWLANSNSFDDLWALDVCREDPTCIMTARFSGRGYHTTDRGVNFSIVNHPLSSLFFSAVIYPERDYAIGMFNSGVFKLVFETNVNVNIEQISTKVPDAFSLYQNFPNPFNPTTTIKFDIRKHSYVTLKIYDLLGRQISTLVDDNLNAGTYKSLFDGKNFESGVYFYVLENSEHKETKKLILLK